MKFLILVFVFSLVFPATSFAQTMSNSSYIIKGTLNSGGGNVSNSEYKLSESLGQTAPGLYSGTNYTVRAGFQYFRKGTTTTPTNTTSTTVSVIPFSFSISQNLIDFGVITPTNPVSRTTNLTVSSETATGFTVIASENKPLTSQSGTIPDTTCDDGTCTSLKASAWKSSLSYGFGYRCDPTASSGQVNVCSADFLSPDSYKPFSTSSQTVMTSITGGDARRSQITYKVNVAGTQAPGLYTNIVTYIASPGF